MTSALTLKSAAAIESITFSDWLDQWQVYMATELDNLLGSLALVCCADNTFIGETGNSFLPHVYGGHLIAQALVCAQQGMGDLYLMQSFHSYFLRTGNIKQSIEYRVEHFTGSIRAQSANDVLTQSDQGHLSARRVCFVTGWQNAQRIFELEVAFCPKAQLVAELDPSDPLELDLAEQLKNDEAFSPLIKEGLFEPCMPKVPMPESLLSESQVAALFADKLSEAQRCMHDAEKAMLIRPVVGKNFLSSPQQCLWLKANGQLPEQQKLHQLMISYATDWLFLMPACLYHQVGFGDPRVYSATLDHNLWFHHEVDFNQWVLFVIDSPVAAGGRGFVRGQLFDRQGRLLVSAIQEGLIRLIDSA